MHPCLCQNVDISKQVKKSNKLILIIILQATLKKIMSHFEAPTDSTISI